MQIQVLLMLLLFSIFGNIYLLSRPNDCFCPACITTPEDMYPPNGCPTLKCPEPECPPVECICLPCEDREY
jgi:hypothetical protein